MRKTKEMLINEILEAFEAYKPLEEQLVTLIDAKIVNGGTYYNYAIYYMYSWKWFYGMLDNDKQSKLYGTGKAKTTLWNYNYHLDDIREKTTKLKIFLSDDYQRGYRKWHLDNDNSEQWEKVREEMKQLNS